MILMLIVLTNKAMVMPLRMIVRKKHPRFVKIWKVNTESGIVSKTDVTELQILREHKDYLSVSMIKSSSYLHQSSDKNYHICIIIKLKDHNQHSHKIMINDARLWQWKGIA